MVDKLLINVAHEETRVALVESGRLANLEIITSRSDANKGNIYKGVVHRVNVSLQAAFIDYGADKQGFLPLPEIHEGLYPSNLVGKRPPIQDVLKQGQDIMVQVVKEEIGHKGAALTTYISVAGRSLAIEAFSDREGISRRVSDEERKRLKKLMNSLDSSEGQGAIMRTAAAHQSDEVVRDNHRYLMGVLERLKRRYENTKGLGLIHQERGLPVRFIRDYVPADIDEILIDDKQVFEEVKNFCEVLEPQLVKRIILYEDPQPLFSRYQIEDQIDDVFSRKIELPSGGSIVIDQTEALVAVDVNSGRVKTDDIEQTALKTNLEAAVEVARQLKIRDRGGLVVIDFIDMREKDHIHEVERTIKEAFSSDKAKLKFSRISEFGLMELSRQRLQGALVRGSFTPCVACGGTGQIRSVESSALYLIRKMKETLLRGHYQSLQATMPVPIANYILNKKRKELVALEQQSDTSIEVVAEVDISSMQAYFKLVSRQTNSSRPPKRTIQRIDLVRSDIEKHELEPHEEFQIEQVQDSDSLRHAPFPETKLELEKETAEIEKEWAKLKAIENAQREADESLRREAELLAQKELEKERQKTIRELESARWKGMSFWGRMKSFFGKGLEPISLDHDEDEDEAKEKKRGSRSRREEAERDERRRRSSSSDERRRGSRRRSREDDEKEERSSRSRRSEDSEKSDESSESSRSSSGSRRRSSGSQERSSRNGSARREAQSNRTRQKSERNGKNGKGSGTGKDSPRDGGRDGSRDAGRDSVKEPKKEAPKKEEQKIVALSLTPPPAKAREVEAKPVAIPKFGALDLRGGTAVTVAPKPESQPKPPVAPSSEVKTSKLAASPKASAPKESAPKPALPKLFGAIDLRKSAAPTAVVGPQAAVLKESVSGQKAEAKGKAEVNAGTAEDGKAGKRAEGASKAASGKSLRKAPEKSEKDDKAKDSGDKAEKGKATAEEGGPVKPEEGEKKASVKKASKPTAKDEEKKVAKPRKSSAKTTKVAKDETPEGKKGSSSEKDAPQEKAAKDGSKKASTKKASSKSAAEKSKTEQTEKAEDPKPKAEDKPKAKKVAAESKEEK